MKRILDELDEELIEFMEGFAAKLTEKVQNPNLSLAEQLRILDVSLAIVAYLDLLKGKNDELWLPQVLEKHLN